MKILVNDKIFLKDPETSALGRKILKESIILMDDIGFEEFTFKKLGIRINSTESSIYRYFENKHKLLLYLSSWYWSWIEYKVVFFTANLTNPTEQLIKAVKIVTEKIEDDSATEHIDESILNRIIITEFSKTFLTKEVDEENREGFFLIYKRVINRLIEMVIAVNPNYPFPKSLVSNIVEGALHQHFLRDHFKSITDCNATTTPTEFYTDLVKRIIKN